MPFGQVDLLKMYNLYVELNSKQRTKGPTVLPYDEFITECKNKGNGFIFSKNMCLMFMSTFLGENQKVRNAISTEIVRYAASNTDISSFFIKVS